MKCSKWNIENNKCGDKCCIQCEKPLSDKFECACECMDYYDKPGECPLSREVADQAESECEI